MGDRRTESFTDLAALAIVIAMVCGIAEAIIIGIPSLTTDHVLFRPARLWIMAPILWTVWLLLVVAATQLIGITSWTRFLLVMCGPALLAAPRLLTVAQPRFAGWRLIIPLSVWAIVFLTLAVLFKRMKPVHGRWLRPVGALVVIALTAALAADPLMARQRMRSRTPLASEKAPHVVLIFLDTFRGDALAEAPKLRKFAATARTYENAYAPYSWTLPSHLAVMTGTGAGMLDVDFDRQAYRGTTRLLAETFNARGFATAAVFANPFLNPSTGIDRGFGSFEYSQADLDVCRTTFGFIVKVLPNARVPACRLTAANVSDRAIAILRNARQPTFLALNYFDTHLPYYVPRRYRPAGYVPFQPYVEYGVLDRAVQRAEDPPTKLAARLRSNYLLSVRYLDDELDRLLKEIRALPNGEATVIAIVGDHGEQFGEHGLMLHSNSVYRQVLHVPLIISGPGYAPSRVAQAVAISGLYETLRVAGGMDGRKGGQLLPASDYGEEPPALSLYRAPRSMRNVPRRLALDAWSVASGPYHLIRYSNGAQELYDTVADPDETSNLIDDPRLAAVRDRMSEHARTTSARLSPLIESRQRLFSLGYMQ